MPDDATSIAVPPAAPLTRYVSPTEAAYLRLGVEQKKIAAMTQITPQIRQIQRQLKRAGEAPPNLPAGGIGPTGLPRRLANFPTDPYYYLAASDHPDAKKVLDVYYSLKKCWRKLLPIEAFCYVAGVQPLRVLELITGTCVALGHQASSMIAAVAHPRVVEKTIEMALTDGGIEDRNALHKAVGFLPTPKGSQTNISVVQNSQQTAAPTVVVAPPPEQTIRTLTDAFNDRFNDGPRALPEPPIADAEIVDSPKDEEE